MKKLFAFLLAAATIAACQQTETPQNGTTQTAPATTELTVLTADNPELQFENLKIYPILASEEVVSKNAALAALKTTAEAMKNDAFRITELKPFGREEGHRVGGLTVANKSGDPVFLMSGDIITGGNQDRVIAEDQVIAANSLKNVDVFCVEAGRWQYFDRSASESDKKIAVFNSYYNVASTEVRQAIHRTGNQQEVWDAVDRVTTANAAGTSTKTYAGLETANEFKNRRDACLKFFDGKLEGMENVIGIVVVAGDKVLGVDIFGHPNLFRQQVKSLLHGFATDALTAKNGGQIAPADVQDLVGEYQEIFADAGEKGNGRIGKFTYSGLPVHLYSK